MTPPINFVPKLTKLYNWRHGRRFGRRRSKIGQTSDREGKRNILITSALPYVNNVPHLGNIIGCVLSADVFARYCRLRGYNAIYVCGTDEYGTATETKAMEENCTPKEICDNILPSAFLKYLSKTSTTTASLESSRTLLLLPATSARNPLQTEVCQAIFKKLLNNNWLSENTMQQLYCDTCKRFLADRLVEGTCPTRGCDYDSARGDQCEKCGKLLNPTELQDPRCKQSDGGGGSDLTVVGVGWRRGGLRAFVAWGERDKEVVVATRTDRNSPFLVAYRAASASLPPSMAPFVIAAQKPYLVSDRQAGRVYKPHVLGWVMESECYPSNKCMAKRRIKARCITRDLKWGVPVPHDKFKDKVFYVWFDAPIGYVSITSGFTTEWEKWWKNPEHVELYQFMGKDNVPFHTVMFPSTLLGTGENWTMMKTISVTEYLNYEAGQLNSNGSSQRVRALVFLEMMQTKDTKIPVEVWRYYLLTNRPEVSDTLFTWADLQSKLNCELLNNLGNFVNRVLSFIAKDPALEDSKGVGYHSVIPEAPGAESHPLTKTFGEKVGEYVEQYLEAMEKVKLKQGLKIAMSISGEGNAYLQESKFWKLYKEDYPSCSVVMKTSAGLVYLLGCLLEPFMPSFSLEVLKQLNLPPEIQVSLSDEKGDIEKAKRPWEFLPAGHKIGIPEPLFKELKDEEVEFFRLRFAGSQADRILKAEAEAKEVAEKLKKTEVSDGKGKKQRPAKSAAEAKPKASGEAETSISRLNIRVGLITKAQKHPDADSLYVEEIDVGEGQPANCSTMRGIKSQAMVLAASNSDHTKVELVEPPPNAAIGERVTFPGFEGDPDDVLNPKKKVWETVQLDLHTDKELVASYKDVPFTTSAGVCKVSSICDCSIRTSRKGGLCEREVPWWYLQAVVAGNAASLEKGDLMRLWSRLDEAERGDGGRLFGVVGEVLFVAI
ncbi:methionine-tRNA ligase, putative [Actinidia rufa]|uniref:methionine--tRNA ligase n=1 Tax=Actinidia rufa TaxID=165716 RepID=A0A7J0FEC8_9ERIC|nr:methionine-tRNA ligase, putative [Actinidia rufa]